MSYDVTFKGSLEYPSTALLEKALKIIDQELEDPEDDFETSVLERDDFDTKEAMLTLEYEASMPASCWYGCMRVLAKLSKDAIKGTIQCDFEGDDTEWIRAGDGYS